MQRLLAWFIGCVAVSLVAALPLNAQMPGFVGTDPQTPGLVGTVVDPQGRPVAGARLHLTGPLGAACTATSADDGRARCDRLADGDYTLRVVADGFRADPLAVRVEHGSASPVIVALEVAALSESLVVTATAVDAPRSTVAASTTIVSAGDLRAAQVDTVAAALASVPGFTITASGGAGIASSVPGAASLTTRCSSLTACG